MSQIVNTINQQLVLNVPAAGDTINVNDEVILNIMDLNPTLGIINNIVNLDVESGGLVPVGNGTLTLTAGTNLSALRAVTTNGAGEVVYASNATLSDAVVVGITETSASTGSQVNILTAGTITDGSWNWTKGPVYLGTNGMLTQVAPTNGSIVVHLGRAITSTTILIDIDILIQTV